MRYLDKLRGSWIATTIKMLFGKLGYSIIPKEQIPSENWAGIKNYSIRTILDIGALRGELAVSELRPNFPEAVIHCFEPSPLAFAELALVASGSDNKITAHNFGLGNETGALNFHVNLDFLAASSFLEQTGKTVAHFPETAKVKDNTVEVRRLDDVISEIMPPIAEDFFIKIDTQGYDYQVLLGGRETLSRARACIVEVSMTDLYKGAPSFHDIYLLMVDAGLRFGGVFDQRFAKSSELLYLDAIFIRD